MTKQIITVPVGEPQIATYANLSMLTYVNCIYLEFGTDTLENTINVLTKYLEQYKSDYTHLTIKPDMMGELCLFGNRYETDLEYEFRLNSEAKDRNDAVDFELNILNSIKSRYEE